MKSGLLTILSVLLWGFLSSQTLVFHENFEPPSGADSVTHYTSSATNTWGLSTTLSAGGTQSDSAKASPFDTLSITSNPFSTTGNGYVVLEFDHICKIEAFDKAVVEVSIDGGVTWMQLDTNHYMGASTQFGSQGNQFNAVSYGGAWSSGQNVTPDNTWWKHETFNLSTIAADQADVRVRFSLIDLNGATLFENYGWFLDNITVIASPSELIPPDISMIPPVITDTIFSSDPQDVRAVITDDSGIDTAYVVYFVNGVLEDTLGMTEFGADSFGVQIPFHGFGRSIAYFVEAIDLAGAANMATTNTYNYFVKFADQDEIIVGGCTDNSSRAPFFVSFTTSGFRYSMHSSIYEASEFNNMGGIIKSIAFNKSNDVGYIHDDAEIDIYIKEHPSGNAVSSNSEWQAEASNATLVYSTSTGGINTFTGWQEFQFDNDFTYSGNEPLLVLVYWYRPNSATANHPEWCADNVGASKATTFAGSSFPPGSSYHGDRPQARFGFEAPSVGNDIGVAEITYPIGGVVTGVPFDITVKVQNYGSDTVANFDVAWELDDVAQTPYIYSGGPLYPDSLSNELVLDSITVTAGPHSIKAWTENPNGNPDFNTINDTAWFNFYGCANLLSGTYTIGGSSADFNTFNEATLGLIQCGIDGPVTFNVAPGIYNEQIWLPNINGASATNTITFQSATGDSSDVVLSYDAQGSGDNYVVDMDGAQHVHFKDMSFEATGTSHSRVILLRNGAARMSFFNNAFSAPVAADESDDFALVLAENTLGNDVTFAGNLFSNGSMGIHLIAQGSDSIVVTQNILDDQFARGIRVNGAQSAQVKYNQVNTNSTIESFTGIWVSQGTGNFQIAYNQVHATDIQHGYGIRVSSSQGDSLSHAMVYNNMVLVNRIAQTTTLSGGIMNMDSRFVDYYYNTIKMTGNDQNSPALIIFDNNPGSSRGLMVKNNIFANFANGYVLYTNTIDTAGVIHDYNNYYADGSGDYINLNGDILNSLQELQAATGGEAASQELDPYFPATTDLTTTNNLLNATGTPVAGINDDIYGNPRDGATPDIGAVEFDPSPYDLALLDILAPADGCGLSANEDVIIRIKNAGSSDVTTFTAGYQFLNGSAPVTETVNQTILAGDTLDYVFSATADLDMTVLMHDSVFPLQAWVDHASDPIFQNDSAYTEVNSQYEPPAPTVTDYTIAYGDSVTITATSADSLYWYDSDTAITEIYDGEFFTTPLLFDTTTYYVAARPAGTGGGFIITEVCHWRGATNGSPVGGWPSYLITDDYIEITGAPGADLGGYTLEQWGSSSMDGTHTFPPGTILSPEGTAIIAVGQLGGSVEDPSNYYYHGNGTYTGNYGSGTAAGRIIIDPNGEIMDAVGYGNYTFPAASGVTPQDWSGATPAGTSTAGNRLEGPYTKDATNWVNSGTSPQTPNQVNPGVVPPAAVGDCESPRVPVTVNVVGYPMDDAGISAIVNPEASVLSGTLQYIDVEVTNYGLNDLTSADISWALDGNVQNTYSWTGLIPYNQIDTVRIDSAVFAGGAYDISAWTSLPNNMPDTINLNDTTHATFSACLTGYYTIGDTATGTYDFPSFTNALQNMDAAGICGHVVFEVDSGTYNETLTINEITGMDQNNTVTFTSLTGDSTHVVLVGNPSSNSEGAILLDGASHFTFSHMTITVNPSASSGRVIQLDGGAHYNKILNCVIDVPPSTTTSYAGVYSTGSLDHHFEFRNNHVLNGYYGVYWRGPSTTSHKKGGIFDNNLFEGFNYYGMYFYNNDSLQVTNNTLISGDNVGLAYGMYAYYIFNGFRIANNEVIMNDPYNSSTKYGIRTGHGNRETVKDPGDATGLVYNNIIYLNTDGSQYGLYSYWDNDVKFYYNTVMLTGSGGWTVRALYHANTSTNTIGTDFMNNLIVDSTGGHAAYYLGTSEINNADYNNYYTIGSTVAYWGSNQATLSDLQTASGMEANSMNVLPQFMSATNLRLADKQLAGRGIAVPEVNYDIDGNPRGTNITTIGAHETELLPLDIGIVDILDIPANVNEYDSLVPRAVVINAGTDTVHNYTIEYIAGNQSPVTYNVVGDTIPPLGTTDTITLPYFNSPAGNYQLCAKTILAGDSNYINDEHCVSVFGTPIYDARVTRVASLASDCNLTNDTVTFTMENIGVDTIDAGFPVSYLVDGITLETETVNQSIAPGDTLMYSFNALVDLSVTTFDSTFNIAVWVDVPGDNVQYNDTGYVETISYHTPVTPLVDDQTLSWGSQAMIIADATAPVFWYLHDTSSVAFHVGDTLMTDLLFADTTYWFQAITGVSGYGDYVGAVDPTIGTSNSSSLTNHYMEFDVLSQSGVNINSVDLFPSSSVGSLFTIELQDASQNVLDTYSGTVAVTGGAKQTVDVDFAVPQGSGYRLGFQVNPGLTRNTNGASYPYDIPGEISITGNTFNVSYWYFIYNWNVSSGTGSVGCESPRDFVDITIIHASDDAGLTGIWAPDGCSMSMEPVTIDIHNAGTDTIDGGLQAAYRVDNNPFITPENVNLIIAPNDTVTYTFNTLADLSSVLTGDTSYIITAYVDLAGDTLYANDTIVSDTILAEYTPLPPLANDVTGMYGDSVTLTATSPDTLMWYENDTIEQHLHMGQFYTTPILYDTTTYWVAAASGGDGAFIITEICHFKTANGAPVAGWPSYLTADDYIEITGAPGSDLGGYTLEQWRGTSMDGTHTFPQGTVLSPEGTAIIAVGQLGSSVEDPSNYYYHGNGTFTGSYGSTTAAGRIIKDPFGEIIDAVVYGNYTFPAAADVTPEDWTGTTPAVSSSGNRLEGPYTKDATNWVNSGTSPQTPNQVNPGVTPPSGTGCLSQRVPLTVNINVPDANAALTDIIVNDGCNLKADELITIEIANMGGLVIDGNITAAYKVNDGPYITPENMTTVIQPGDTSLYTFNTPANMLAPMGDTAFVIKAYVALAGDTFPHNDTLVSDTIESLYTPDVPVLTDIDIPFGTYGQLQATTNYFVQWYDHPNSPDPIDTGDVFTTPLLYDTTTYYASAAVEGDGGFIITEICHFKTGNGEPVGGWPSYLVADDYIEITGPSGADLGGYTLEQWRGTSMDGTHTFPQGTVLSPQGTAIIAVGQLGSSVEDPSNYYYHGNGNFTGLYSSTTEAGRIIKDPSGDIIEAVGYGSYTFPPASGVTPQDWSGTTPAVSSSGNRLEGPYTKDATNWVNSGTSPQTPNQVNPGVEQPKGIGCESDRVPVTVNVTGAPPIDGQLLAIQDPATGFMKTTQEPVTMIVKNNGTSAFNTVELTYEFNNQSPVTEVLNQTINPGDTVSFTFSSTVNMGDFTTYPLKAYIAVPGDTVNLNDTIITLVENRKDYCDSRATSSTYNYIEHVSVGGIDNASSGSATYTDFTDIVAPGILYPGVDHPIEITWASTSTFFGSVSVKVYVDVNRDGIFDPVGEAFMGQTIGSDTSNVFSGIINLPSNAQPGLTVMRIVLQRTGDLTDIEPCGTYTYGETEDYLIQVTPLIPQDGGVVAITRPSHFMMNANQQFEVLVKNFGSDTLSNVDIEYSFANVNNVFTYSGSIAPQAVDTVVMPMITVPYGNHTLCAFTAVPGDSNTFNDGMCKAIYRSFTTSPPYADDFEGNNYFMRDTSGGKVSTIWELGYPMGQNIVGAYSGGNAWMTGLNRDYEPSSTEILYSPKFAITSQGVDSLMFWQNMDAEKGADGGYVQYLNVTGNWSTLGAVNDTGAVNWYTDTIIGQAAFSGNTNGWMRSAICIDDAHVPNMASITQFRFVFVSGGSSNTGDGWAIDNFRIAIPQSDYDAGVTQINAPADSTVVGDDVTAEVSIRNYGLQTLSQIPVSYRVNNQMPVTETWTGTLDPGAVTTFTFNQSYTAPGNDYNLCAYTELAQDGDHSNDTTCKVIQSTKAALDAGVTDLIVVNDPDDAGPDTTWQFRDVIVEVEIYNFGTDELTTMDVEYQRGTLPSVTETWTGSLMPGQSTTYSFNQMYTSPAGSYTLCGRTALTGDADPSNDETCRALTGVQYIISVEESLLPGFVLHQNQPNPARDETTVAFEVPYAGNARFELTDVMGRTLMVQEMKPNAGKHLLELQLDHLAPGIYYYSVTFDQHKLVKKMIINK